MGRAVLAEQPGDISLHVGAFGGLPFPGRPVLKRQRQDLVVVQAPLDRGGDQPGQLPGAVPTWLLQLAGQMRRQPLGQLGGRRVQRQRRFHAGGGRVGRQQPVKAAVAAAHRSHSTSTGRPPAARGLWL
jgi:hypothetical protein